MVGIPEAGINCWSAIAVVTGGGSAGNQRQHAGRVHLEEIMVKGIGDEKVARGVKTQPGGLPQLCLCGRTTDAGSRSTYSSDGTVARDCTGFASLNVVFPNPVAGSIRKVDIPRSVHSDRLWAP